ncbi:LOW QUALITY PROTEIN: hypothetical protein SC1083_1327 [Aggregatibacter actinomycetemcomitans serotype e str. SC1083]|uniref:Uncharacterized protein n=1 Tax=Aggregatibacter actinomycetemcomitans serotype e str. SC1083 TaxID=907488 RepID=G4A919_AGGAC|nr:LOW QUALITY PROTEIN: hypothetical protein SC1083_1327 [Aggregatibacter actinomycetemcomitans serotype e str. SC1083]
MDNAISILNSRLDKQQEKQSDNDGEDVPHWLTPFIFNPVVIVV